MALVTLRVLDGADRGKVFENIPTPVTIGREEGNSIQVRASGATVTLSWPQGGVLQKAGNLANPSNWSDVPGATSPWPVSMTATQGFYRVFYP